MIFFVVVGALVSYCACANTRVPAEWARRRGRLSRSSVMYQRHKLLKRLTLIFLLISVGLWTIRIIQIHWNPCKNHEVVRKIAQIFNHPASTSKGVEQDHPATQSKVHVQFHIACIYSCTANLQISVPGLKMESGKLLVDRAQCNQHAMPPLDVFSTNTSSKDQVIIQATLLL